jgi:uncharacterized protein (TIGR02118 family)
MAKVIAMYKRPTDTAAFDRYYFDTHVPIAKKIHGLRQYEVTTGPVATLQGESPYYLVAVLTFDSMTAVRAALASPEGQATAADFVNFATAGVDVYLAESRIA